METKPQITRILERLGEGEAHAWDDLFPLVYDELRRLARAQLRGQQEGHTLNTTALVHETYLKLAKQASLSFNDRAHFMSLCARAMRQVLIDYARKRATARRGGGWKPIALNESVISVDDRAEILLALDEALDRLSRLNERLARVVECRFFGGMTEEETAAALGVTDRTVRRDWTKARLWLHAELGQESA